MVIFVVQGSSFVAAASAPSIYIVTFEPGSARLRSRSCSMPGAAVNFSP